MDYQVIPGSSRAPRPAGTHKLIRKVVKANQTSRKWLARAVTGNWEMVVFQPEDHPDQHPDGKIFESEFDERRDLVLVLLKPSNKKQIAINLTLLTEEELACLRDTFDAACDLALEEVKKRDELAKERARNGDGTSSRLYRPVPSVRFGSGQRRVYDSGIQHGPEDAVVLEWRDKPPGDGVLDQGDQVPTGAGERHSHESTEAG